MLINWSLSRSSFLGKLFRPFQESNDKTCKHRSKRIPARSPPNRPGEAHQKATVDWTCHGSHPVKKSRTESNVAFCEVRFVEIQNYGLGGDTLDLG